MAVRLLVFIITMFGGNSLHAQLVESKNQTYNLTKESIVADIDEYASLITKKHINPFEHVKKSVFLHQLQQLRDAANKYNADELMVRWLKINSLVQDDGTNILFDGRDVFPLSAFIFEEGVYIIGTNAEYLRMLNAKIISVNDRPIDSIVKDIALLSPNRNSSSLKWAVTTWLFNPYIIHGLGIAAERNKISYKVVTETNDTVSFTPQTEDRRDVKMICYNSPLFADSTRESYDPVYVSKGNYVYFDFASCFDNSKHHFSEVKKHLEKIIKENRPDKIIIDMRNPQFGWGVLFSQVRDYLSTSYLNKKGKIYVLIGRGSSSNTISSIDELKRATYARVVGEETRINTTFYWGDASKTLPATKLVVYYSTSQWYGHEKTDGPLIPDVSIPRTFSDHYNKVDAALNYAIKE